MNKIRQWFIKSRTFITEVRAEWKKVTRPGRQDVINTTVVVVVTSFIFALYLWLSDIVIIWLYEGVIAVIGKVGNVFS